MEPANRHPRFHSPGNCQTAAFGTLIGLIMGLFVITSAPTAQAADPTLDRTAMGELIEQHHPAVLESRAALAEAEAELRSARFWPNPELEGRYLWMGTDIDEIEAVLKFRLPVSGRVSARRRAAEIRIEMSQTAYRTTLKNANLELDRLLARLSWAQTLLDLHQTLAERSSKYAALARARLSATVMDPLDVSLILADAARDRRAAIRGRKTVRVLESEVRLLLGLGTDAGLLLTTPLVYENPEGGGAIGSVKEIGKLPSLVTNETLIDAAREHRGSWVTARLAAERAEWEVKQASRERFPDLTLGPAMDRVGGESSYGLAVGVPLPIFTTGRGQKLAALARLDAAGAALEYEIRQAGSDIELTLARVSSLNEELDELADVLGSVGQSFDLAEARFSAGKIDALRLLSAHRAFADAKKEELGLLLSLEEARLDLEQAVGYPIDSLSPETQP